MTSKKFIKKNSKMYSRSCKLHRDLNNKNLETI